MLENLRVWFVLKLIGNEFAILDAFNQSYSKRVKKLELKILALEDRLSVLEAQYSEGLNDLESLSRRLSRKN